MLYVQTSCFASEYYKCIAFLMSLLLLQLLLLRTALYFDVKGQCHDIWKNPKGINLYRVKLPVITKMFLFC